MRADGKQMIADAAQQWLKRLEADGRERATVEQYEQHLRLHILPVLGRVKLAKLNTETIESFRAFLLAKDEKGVPVRSRDQAVKVWVTFKSLLKHARCAHLGQGVTGITPDHRAKRKLEIGVDVPTNDEIKRLFDATSGPRPEHKRKRALLLVAAFCGLRASELRGLRWADVKLDEAELQVTQRADRYGKIGSPKTVSSRRTVPMSPDVVRALREWKIAQGGGELTFGTRKGGVRTSPEHAPEPAARDARRWHGHQGWGCVLTAPGGYMPSLADISHCIDVVERLAPAQLAPPARQRADPTSLTTPTSPTDRGDA